MASVSKIAGSVWTLKEVASCRAGNPVASAVDWVVGATQNKGSPNQVLDHRLALASKVVVSGAALAGVAVAASAEALGATAVVLVETEAASAEIEVGMADEAVLATKAEVALEAEEDSQMAHHRQMHRVDQVEGGAVGMVVGMEAAPRTVLDPTMATAAVAMDMVPAATIVAARAAHPGLTAVEINVVG
jgi:NADPH-dependent glutamate synthase beta subunit-like oxidoreductase